jgi:hypothetical protein
MQYQGGRTLIGEWGDSCFSLVFVPVAACWCAVQVLHLQHVWGMLCMPALGLLACLPACMCGQQATPCWAMCSVNWYLGAIS